MQIMMDVTIWLLITSIPSKKRKRIKQNITVLKKQVWFSNLIKNKGFLLLFNADFRNIIGNYDLTVGTNQREKISSLKRELETFVYIKNL